MYLDLPFSCGNAPALARADVVSMGRWVRTAEAVMVSGRSASSWSSSGMGTSALASGLFDGGDLGSERAGGEEG